MAVTTFQGQPLPVLIRGEVIRYVFRACPAEPEGTGMDSSGVVFATPVRTFRASFAAVCLAIALLITGALAAAAPTRAASPEPLKAVFIVGPAGVQTSADLADAEELATLAESYGMDVRRVFFPPGTT